MNEKYKFNLEVIADREEGILRAVEAALDNLNEGVTIRDFTDREGTATSFVLKHGVPESVLAVVRRYYTSVRREIIISELTASLEKFSYLDQKIPPNLWDGLVRYVVEGRGTGDFLMACFENHLGEAISHADGNSIKALPAVHAWMYNWIPSVCYGSYKDVQLWFEAHAIVRAENR